MIGATPIASLITIILCPLIALVLSLFYFFIEGIVYVAIYGTRIAKEGYKNLFKHEYLSFNTELSTKKLNIIIRQILLLFFLPASSVIYAIYCYITNDGIISFLGLFIILISVYMIKKISMIDVYLYRLIFALFKIIIFIPLLIIRFMIIFKKKRVKNTEKPLIK